VYFLHIGVIFSQLKQGTWEFVITCTKQGQGKKRQRAGTPLRAKATHVDTPVRKRVRFKDQESPEDEELQRVTEENAKISISHSDMRAVCVRDRPHAQGSSSSSSSYSSSMVYDVDAETYEEGRNIYIHIHRGGK
jgi:hypothetical protein